MDFMNFLESIFRWLHVVFGILWIGLLYFFNFVNGPFEGTMDGDTKKKVVPELTATGALLVPLGRGVHVGDRRPAVAPRLLPRRRPVRP